MTSIGSAIKVASKSGRNGSPPPPPELLRGRLSVVTAAAGYGKTTAVDRWLRESGVDAEVLDDVHPDRMPSTVSGAQRLVLISRHPLPVAALLNYRLGAPVEIGPRQLALSPRRVTRLLAQRYGLADPGVAASVHELTAGWPVLVELAAARLASEGTSGQLLDMLTAPFTALHEYVCGQVLADLPADARELLSHLAELGSISMELAAAIGQGALSAQLALLARTGLLLPPAPGQNWYRPVALVAEIMRTAHPLPPAQRAKTVKLAAQWHARHGRPADALRLGTAAGHEADCAQLLREHGAAILAGGDAAGVVAAVGMLSEQLRDNAIELVYADALQAIGATTSAIDAYARLAGDAEQLPPDLAWRYGAALYLGGNPNDALAVLRRGQPHAGAAVDRAHLLAWTSAAHWLTGDETECSRCAAQAYEIASLTGDDRALAASHIALALYAHLAGDSAGLRAHYGQALEHAESAADNIQVLRIRANLAAALEQEGRLDEALSTLDPAVQLAQSTGYESLQALVLANQGALLHRLGRLDDAVISYQHAVHVYQRMHSRKIAYPLTGLGDIHRLRGHAAQAKTAYLEALREATEDGQNRQGLVPALAGLAQVVAESDPEQAAAYAEQAMTHARGHWITTALVARAWVCLHGNAHPDARAGAHRDAVAAADNAAAHRDAVAAADNAAAHRDKSGLAQALEVQAAATDNPAAARELLREALAIWTQSQATLEADRIRVALGRVAGDDSDLRLNARLAESRLATLGVALAAPTRVTCLGGAQVRVLGGFCVLVNGRPLPPKAWQSRKARDLLRVLIARRGSPVSREEMIDLLWGPVPPAEHPKAGHRLAVALSTLRAVLDPDRRAPQDYYILASQKDIAADFGTLSVDVADLFAQAQYGMRLRERGRFADAWTVLIDAERAYVGEVFADDPFSDWTRPLREEARATRLRILRMLVELAQRSGEVDDVVEFLLRILSMDRYDEQAHRELISSLAEAGRHGEALRAFEQYAEAMREIGVPVREVRGIPARHDHPAR